LERAALLTPAPGRRAERLLTAARAKRDAGELDAALRLLVAAEAGPLVPLQTAEAESLRGQIASYQGRDSDAARLLLSAARFFEPLDVALARETYLEAIWAAMFAGDPGREREAAEAARAAPPAPDPPRAVDVVLDALALWFTEGHAAAAPALTRALGLLVSLDAGVGEARRSLWSAGGRASAIVALELWDFESWHALAARQVQIARDMGALAQLQFALARLGLYHVLAGQLAEAAQLIEEERLIAYATGNPPIGGYAAMTLAAWEGREQEPSGLTGATVPGRPDPERAGWPASRRTRARCWATAWAGTTAHGTPPARYSSVKSWGSATWSPRSWPRRRPGLVTWRPSGACWTGCPNAPG
jgi:hypothetical protein